MFMKFPWWRKLVQHLTTPPSSWSGGSTVQSKSKQNDGVEEIESVNYFLISKIESETLQPTENL